MNNIKVLLARSIYSGILIGIAAMVYISSGSLYIGAFLFSFALLLICNMELNLYTGKIGYILEKDKLYLVSLLLIIVGNFIGIIIMSLIANLANLSVVIDGAKLLSNYKISHEPLVALFLAIPCGMLMYLAVNSYQRLKSDLAKTLVIMMAVVIFIVSGFEHSIANLFYFTVSLSWNLQAIWLTLLMLLGNAIGAIFLNYLERYI